MLPNRFPDAGEAAEYNTVDATLWFFEAVRSYLQCTADYEFVRSDLYPVLKDIVEWHVRYAAMAEKARASFNDVFRNEQSNYLYDVVNGGGSSNDSTTGFAHRLLLCRLRSGITCERRS
jgi:glycogen debranching enzyme